jgi:hypothetical protein
MGSISQIYSILYLENEVEDTLVLKAGCKYKEAEICLIAQYLDSL